MSDETPKKRPGREPGKYLRYPAQHAVRFTERQWATIRTLAERWKVSEAEVVRRAVEDLAKKERIE